MHPKLTAVFLLAFLVFISVRPTSAVPRKVVGLDVTYRTMGGQREYRVKDIQLDSFRMLFELERSLDDGGYEVRRLNGLTPSSLLDVDAVVLGKLRDPSWQYTADEIKAIGEWFNQGGKLLWVGSDSDYVEPYYVAAQGDFKQREPNKVLEAVRSPLRLEFSSVEDVVGAGALGAPIRVCAMDTLDGVNAAGYAGVITKGTSRVLFDGPSVIIGFKTGRYVSIEEVLDENIFWLYRTSAQATIVDHDATRPMVLRVGQKGRFVLAAAQAVKVGDKFSKIVVTGESILGDRNISSANYGDLKLSGPVFVRNALAWGLQKEPTETLATTTATTSSAGEAATTATGSVAFPLTGMILAILVIASLTYVRKLKQTVKLDQTMISKAELPPGRELYEEYLRRLEELKARKRIPEHIYVRLKEEYEKRLESRTLPRPQ